MPKTAADVAAVVLTVSPKAVASSVSPLAAAVRAKWASACNLLDTPADESLLRARLIAAATKRAAALATKQARLAAKNAHVAAVVRRKRKRDAERRLSQTSSAASASTSAHRRRAEVLRRRAESAGAGVRQAKIVAFVTRCAARRIQRAWRKAGAPTAAALAAKLAGALPPELRAAPFEDVCKALQGRELLRDAAALLDKADAKLAAQAGRPRGSTDHLLRRLPATKRFPERVVLCAVMIVSHPEEVFNQVGGTREVELQRAAAKFLAELDALVAAGCGSRALLRSFDEAWELYLDQFVAWKAADATALEADLVGVAVELLRSMFRKCGTVDRSVPLSHDKEAIIEQVELDHRLLRERVAKLTGEDGVKRFDERLEEVRAACEAEEEANAVASAAFVEAAGSTTTTPPSSPSSGLPDAPPVNVDDHICQELMHDPLYRPQGIDDDDEDDDAEDEHLEGEELQRARLAKAVKAQMQRAFWDGVEQDLAASPPVVARVTSLLGEIRDGLETALPEERAAAVSAALAERTLVDALSLSAAEAVVELRTMLDKVAAVLHDFGDAAEHARAWEAERAELLADTNAPPARLVSGALRFLFAALKRIQREALRAHVAYLAAVLAPHGPSWARKRFAARHGLGAPGADARERLPRTAAMLSGALDALAAAEAELVPALARAASGAPVHMRTGRVVDGERGPEADEPRAPTPPRSPAGLVRLGLLAILQQPDMTSEEALAETLRLDHMRLVVAQNHYQGLLVKAAALLLAAQLGSTEPRDALAARVDAILRHPDATLATLAAEVARSAGADDSSVALAMLRRMTKRDDALFARINGALAAALRAAVLLGPHAGTSAVKAALQRCGAGALLPGALDLAERVHAVASVSGRIHGEWYNELADHLLGDEM